MHSSQVPTILEALSSGKLRQRSQALDDLTSLLKQDSESFPSKYLYPTIETLVEIIEGERIKYEGLCSGSLPSSESKLTAVENRLSSASYVLRVVVETKCTSFKSKHLKFLLTLLPELMAHHGTNTMLPSTATHLLCALDSLVESEIFQCKFELHQWILLVKKITACLSVQLDTTVSSKDIMYMLKILESLLSLDCASLEEVAADFVEAISKCLRGSNNENANTKLMMQLINTFVLKCHLIDYFSCLDLLHLAMLYFLRVRKFSTAGIDYEFSIFNILMCQLMPCARLDSYLPPTFDRDRLSLTFEDYVIVTLANYDPYRISVADFQFKKISKRIDWLEFEDFQLRPQSDVINWLRLYSLSQLVKTHYNVMTSGRPEEGLLFKRPKLEDNLASFFRNAFSQVTFICNCLESEDKMIQLTGLQVSAFIAATSNIFFADIDRISDLIIQKSGDPQLEGWVVLALIPLISDVESRLSDKTAQRIFRLGLPLLKTIEICLPVCTLLTSMLKYYPASISSDVALAHQINNLYEMIDVNGPAILADESLEFWKYVYPLGPTSRYKPQESAYTKIGLWLRAKINQFGVQNAQGCQLHSFVAWLAGINVAIPESTKYSHFLRWEYSYYSQYTEFSRERRFLLQRDRPDCKVMRSVAEPPQVATEANSMEPVFTALLQAVRHSHEDPILAYRWCCECVKIIQNLVGGRHLNDYLEDLKSELYTTACKLATVQMVPPVEILLNLSDLQSSTFHSQQFFSTINVLNLSKNLKGSLNDKRHSEPAKDFEGFDNFRKDKNQIFDFSGKHDVFYRYTRSSVDLMTEILLGGWYLAEGPNASRCVKNVLDFIEDLPEAYVIQAIPSILKFLDNATGSNINLDTLEQLTQKLGSSLLNVKLNTSNISISYLSHYLNSIRRFWLKGDKGLIEADCKDILDWIMATLAENRISGVTANVCFARLLLNMLECHDLSGGLVEGGKQRVFSSFISCVRRLPSFAASSVMEGIGHYMTNISAKNQNIVFSELVDIFRADDGRIEKAAFHALVLLQVGECSFHQLKSSIVQMLSNAHKTHNQAAAFYVEKSLVALARSYGLGSRQELFHICRFAIINFWFEGSIKNQEKSLDCWHIELFDFLCVEDFLALYSAEISAFYFSRKTKLPFVINCLKQRAGGVEANLLKSSLHLAIPLCYSSPESAHEVLHSYRKIMGKEYGQSVKELAKEICYWILQLTKWEPLDELKHAINEHFPNSKLLAQLFSDSSYISKDKDNSKLHIIASVSISLLKAHITTYKLDHRDLSFLLARLACLLEDPTSKCLQQSIFRSIKCLLIVFEPVLVKSGYLVDMVRALAPYLKIHRQQDEVSSIIQCIITLDFDPEIEFTEMLSSIFTSLLKDHQDWQSSAKEDLVSRLSSVVRRPRQKYSKTWEACLKVLANERLESDVYRIDELLQVRHASEDRIALLSQLFDFHKSPGPFELDYSFSPLVVANLTHLSALRDKGSSNFNLWRGYYVGGFCLENALLPSMTPGDSVDESLIYTRKAPLESIIQILLKRLKKAATPQSYFTMLSVTCLALASFSKHTSFLEQISEKDTRLYLGERLTHLSEREFELLYRQDLGRSYDISSSGISSTLDSTYHVWLISLLNHLSSSLSNFLPGFRTFRILEKESLSFLEPLLLNMFFLLIQLDRRDGTATLLEFLKSIESVSTSPMLDHLRPKVLFALKLFSMVRSESRSSNTKLSSVYTALDLKRFFELSCVIGEMQLAYMIYEERFSSIHTSDVPRLNTVFDGIRDHDLICALPAEASLSSAIYAANKFDPEGLRSFMFNNSRFDVDSVMSENPDKEVLIKCSNLNGFNGLADALSDINSTLRGSEKQEAFSWSISLGRWELPAPDVCTSCPETFYSLLKDTNTNSSLAANKCRSLLISTSRDPSLFVQEQDWAKSLCAILCSELFLTFSNDISKLKMLLEHTKRYDRLAIENTSFSDHRLVMKSRRMFLSLIGSNGTENKIDSSLRFCELVDLATYLNHARDSGSLQETMTAAMLLDEKGKDLDNIMSSQCWSRLATFEGAQALWVQNEQQIAITMMKSLLKEKVDLEYDDLGSLEIIPQISDVTIKRLLVEWSCSLRKETPQSIYGQYIADSSNEVSAVEDFDERAEIFYKFGEFCFQQVKHLKSDNAIEERRGRLSTGLSELSSLADIVKDSSLPDQDRKEAKKHHNRLRLQVEQDRNLLDNLTKQLQIFTWKCLHFFLSAMVYSGRRDDDVFDKFCGLWFEFAENGELNSKLYHEISSIPSFKFLPWINQMTSRLNLDATPFQRALRLTLKRVMFKLPNETLYPLISLRLYKKIYSISDPSFAYRIKAVEKLFAELEKYDNGQFSMEYLNPIEQFCHMCVELCCMKISKGSRSIQLENLRVGSYWLKEIKKQNVALPTNPVSITCSADGRKPRATITHLDSSLDVSTSGLSLPKIATFHLSDGTKHKVLLKGSNDDLRQDAIMEQVFKQVNQILLKNKQTRRFNLRIRTYEVVPLGPQAGLIEFVSNSKSLHEILGMLHKDDTTSFDKARKLMKSVQSKSVEERVDIYCKIENSIKPQLRRFFFDSFPDAKAWLDAKYAYTKGVVTTSIVGFVLGLGDRHLNNILIDESNGEPVHIDLGVAFDQGKFLPIPELVPFRLTRDIIDGFGVTGVEGIFRKNCERVFSALRGDCERVMNVLNVLKWDPLYSWAVSPLRKRKLQANISDDSEDLELSVPSSTVLEDNNESLRALRDVQHKLEGGGLSVEATVQELIQQATDVKNLATIYMGWSPFY